MGFARSRYSASPDVHLSLQHLAADQPRPNGLRHLPATTFTHENRFDTGGKPGPSHGRHDGKGSAVPRFPSRPCPAAILSHKKFEPGVQVMRDQLTNFRQAAVVLLLLTNALSVAAAAY